MPKLRADDQTGLNYRVIGSGPRTVVMVHGWMASGSIFDDLLEVLDHTGLKLIVPDLRGTGESEPSQSGYSIERYGRDVLAIAEAEGARKFTLVGHSMGGQISQWIAAEAPDRVSGLVTLCAVPAGGAALPPEARELFSSSAGDEGKLGTILDLACKQLPAEAKARMVATAVKIDEACIRGAFEAWTAGGFAERLSAITAPTLVVATDDPFLPLALQRAEIQQKIAGARVAYLPGPGHYPLNERPAETAAIVSAFLAGA
jgi:non-heme chloroperoxidase